MPRINPVIAGTEFGRWVVLVDSLPSARNVRCRCECGTEKPVSISNLRSGASQSCGCIRRDLVAAKNLVHGMSAKPEYAVWCTMIQRCTNPNDRNWANYGGRGIGVCRPWRESFEAFYADMGPRPEGLTLERIDNDQGYTPGNCKWATRAEQMNNTRRNQRNQIKPPFTYFGSKTLLARKISGLLPPHGHYVEPYCGSLAVLLTKPVSPMETVNDLDRSIVTFWKMLRERPADLAHACALTPHSLAEFCDAETEDGEDEIEVARRVWARLTQGRSGAFRNTGWRHYVTAGGSAFGMPNYLKAYVDRLLPAAERLHHVSLECRPAIDVIRWYGRAADVLLYVDPPYLRSTRSSGGYRHEMTEAEHVEMAAALREAKASVVLSGYPSELYDRDLFPDWHRAEFASGTGQNADRWENRTEVLWSNRPFPSSQDSLFDLEADSA